MTVHALIIDDDAASVYVLQNLLARSGVKITTISTLSRDIRADLLDALPVDIVFLDLEMPVMNGYEVLEELLASSEYDTVPVVAHTIHISHLSVAYDAGFHSFIGKPLNRHTFEDNLKRILGGEQIWEVT